MKCYQIKCNNPPTLLSCPRCARAACHEHQVNTVPEYAPKYICQECAQLVTAEREAQRTAAEKARQEQVVQQAAAQKQREEAERQRAEYMASTEKCFQCGGNKRIYAYGSIACPSCGGSGTVRALDGYPDPCYSCLGSGRGHGISGETPCTLCDKEGRVPKSRHEEYLTSTESCHECGGTTTLSVTESTTCSTCWRSSKTGYVPDSAGDGWDKCPDCRGRGYRDVTEKRRCGACDLNGRVPKRKRVFGLF